MSLGLLAEKSLVFEVNYYDAPEVVNNENLI